MPRLFVAAASVFAVSAAVFFVPWLLVPLGALPVAPRFLPVVFGALLVVAVAAGCVVVATAPGEVRRRSVLACVACLVVAVVVQVGSVVWGMFWYIH